MTSKSGVYNKIGHLLSEEPSEWMADEKFREDNAETLFYSQSIALRILRRLRELGMTQNDLSDKIGVQRQQVNKWLKGNDNFTLDTICKLSKAVDLQVAELFQPHFVKDRGDGFHGKYSYSRLDNNGEYKDMTERGETKVIPLNSFSQIYLVN